PPTAISAAAGWNLVASGSFTGIGNTTTTTTQTFLTGLSITIPANTTRGVAIFATAQRYSTITGTPSVTNAGVTILAGTNISYGGGTPPAAPTFSPRGWIGTLTFAPAVPCAGQPAAGTVYASTALACPTQPFTLNINGGSTGSGMAYQWQSRVGTSGPWTNIAGATSNIATVTQTAVSQYRVYMVCANGGLSDTSQPFTMQMGPCYCVPT